ncbi:MAG: sensor histidine kinase, partial [Anaerovoracaceae bacterium]
TMVSPILEIKKELKKVEEENKRIENIRKEFVANVTHELKTPLTSISGFIETLQAGAVEKPEVREKFLDIMSIETSRLKRLIEDILVLSDIEAGSVEMYSDKIYIKDTIDEIADFIKPIADKNKIDIIVEIEEELFLLVNEDRFRQMFVNLIENAVKYSDTFGRVWIKSTVTDDKVIISVIDEGIGIAEEQLERLFERFYRVDKSRSRKVGGTGLGLSIVKHIAALFGAELNVTSELGKGSKFSIIFNKM